MHVQAFTQLGKLLRRHSEVREILGWYGIRVTGAEMSLSLAELCEEYGLDVEDVLIDLQAVLYDEDEEYADEDDGPIYAEQWPYRDDEYNSDGERHWQDEGDDNDR